MDKPKITYTPKGATVDIDAPRGSEEERKQMHSAMESMLSNLLSDRYPEELEYSTYHMYRTYTGFAVREHEHISPRYYALGKPIYFRGKNAGENAKRYVEKRLEEQVERLEKH